MCFGRRGGWRTGGSVELLRQRELMPVAEKRRFPWLLLSVYTVLSKEAAQPVRWKDGCLDQALQRWWSLPTAMREEQVCSQGSEGTGGGSAVCEWGFLGGEDQKVPECRD